MDTLHTYEPSTRWASCRARILRAALAYLRTAGSFRTLDEIAHGLGRPDLRSLIADALTESVDSGKLDAIISNGVWRFGRPKHGGGSAVEELAELLGVPAAEAQERAVRATLGRVQRSLGEGPRRVRAPRGRA